MPFAALLIGFSPDQMDISPTDIPDVLLLCPPRHGDARGFFSETWSREAFRQAGIDLDFVQDNHARSAAAGTLRGLHFQMPPASQAKLVSCPRGAIFDVAVDLRRGSPSFGRHVGAVISAEAWNQLLVPIGFAHGYVTLEPETVVTYKVTARYAPELEQGLRWNDPALGIAWPLPADRITLSARDRAHPPLADLEDLF